MNSDRMFELAQALAVAKSRQDVPAALAVLHVDMLLETPAFGTSARVLVENEKVLSRFFVSFPDYNVVLEGHAASGSSSTCRSYAPSPASRPMRSGGGFLAMPPPGSRPRNDTFPVTQDCKHASRFTRQTRRRDQDGAIVRHRHRPQSKTEHR